MLTCVIIDDEQHALDLLRDYVSQVSFLDLKGTFNNPLEALHYVNEQPIDLIFVDIQMPQLTGLDFIKLVKRKTNIIITSAFKEYALEGFEYEVVDYLLKPISYDRFFRAVQRVMSQLAFEEEKQQEKQSDYIVVKTDAKNKLQKIELKEISHIEGLKNYVAIHTDQQRIVTLLNMKDLDESLPKDQFIRVHKSYIIAIERIKSIDGNQIYLKNVKDGIQLSDTYKTTFFNILKQSLVGNKRKI